MSIFYIHNIAADSKFIRFPATLKGRRRIHDYDIWEKFLISPGTRSPREACTGRLYIVINGVRLYNIYTHKRTRW